MDLGACPLTNTPPVRRLGLLRAKAGTTSTVTVAWVLVPSLEVVASRQTYTALGEGRVRFALYLFGKVWRSPSSSWIA